MEAEGRKPKLPRRQRRLDSPFEHIPFRLLRNPLPPLEMASAEQVEEIHQGSLDILEDIGLEFQDEEALDLWQQAGAKVDRASRRVRPDRELVMAAVAQAPAAFTWQARNPERNLFIGQNAINFAPQAGMAYAIDLDQGRRMGTLADYEKFLKLVHMCNALHFATTWVLEPQDVPVSLRHLKRLPTLLRLTDKAAWGSGNGREISTDEINMARIAFGERMEQGNVIGTVINVSSPLRYDQRMLGGIITYARAKQALIITPFILAGAMSPITLASALAQQNAEALAGIALAQLINPGTPVLYGGFTTNIDMRTGSPAFGTPEGAWALLIGAQLARRYELPFRGNGGLTTAKLPDAQAAYESMWNIWPAVLAHTNMVIHAAGWLDGGLTGSFEKFIIDVEGLAMFHHFLAGPTIDRESLALNMIAEIGPGGHHFGTTHTQARYRTEFYPSSLSDRLNYETWADRGGLDAARRANQIWKQLLAEYEPPPLDPAIKEALQDYTERRERELADRNLYE
jgi:trimethylamine--corrinoid protein Co-methyltransferase